MALDPEKRKASRREICVDRGCRPMVAETTPFTVRCRSCGRLLGPRFPDGREPPRFWFQYGRLPKLREDCSLPHGVTP